MTTTPPSKPQPVKLRQAGDNIIDRLNKREPFIEIDILPDKEGQVVTYLEVYRSIQAEAEVRRNSTYQPTKDRAPKGWEVKDVDAALVRFNTDGSVTFLIELKYTSGSLW